MATERGPAQDRAGVNVTNWGALMLLALVVIAALAWRLSGTSADPAAQPGAGASTARQESTAPTVEIPTSVIPMPSGISGTVLNPGAYGSELVPMDEALRQAKGTYPHLVGADPLVRLLHVTATQDEPQIDAVAWVFLSPDASVWIHGPGGVAVPSETYVHYGWVFVDINGTVLMGTANSYPESEGPPPPLPAK